ncbi:hypothetical protein Q5P01_000712 [Channa striata]|uniref:Reverse transcriptase domain-containing protein n=1 Tax=Channa striata TaxID=64152 RepID=A0AA88LFP5_CHASR|nr:hypothetical protein Q5P01_000712 [Channa striata]
MSQNVIVLAENFKLSKAQFDLLNRGLTFIPTLDIHKDQKGRLQFDIQEYHRKIQLAALRELMRNRHIVIKPADKGSVVVILSRQQYIAEVSRQLEDNMYYKKLEEPIYLETVPMVHDILDKLKRKKFITGNQNKYLKGEIEPRSRRFYILPKVHKAPEKWTVPYRIPPGRPIVSDCDSETYRTAEYVDYFLNPLSVKHTSYVKDTYHFIDIVRNLSVPPDSLFFTIDIDSLYTNIDTTAGLVAVQRVFQKYPDKRRPDKQILELLEINLNRNDFEFNGEFYLQIKGTAMGKKFAPAYANIFMANWEEEALAKCPIKPLHYLRYLDDIWGIWTGTMEQFEGFIHILNTHDPSIKLKYNKHQQCIDFLDTTVYKGQLHSQTHKLDIKVYFKETDTHALLFKTSFHPQHTYRGLIKSQLIRFWRICTQEEDFRGAVTILFAALRKRGYSRSFLRGCLKSFRLQKSKGQKEMVPLITTFSSVSTRVNHKIKNNFQTFIQNEGLLPDHRVILAYRRNKNLKDFLVHAKLKPVQEIKKHQLAKQFCNLKYIRNKTNKRIFEIQQRFSPHSANCVYLIFCAKCGKQYVGETKHSISTRMIQHRYNIRNQKAIHTVIVRHFILHGLQSVRIAGLQKNSIWTDPERKKWERRWIYWLNTKDPFGLNQQ